MTFRMRGHEEASGHQIYVPQELFDKWAKKDPVNNYEQFFIERKKIISQQEIDDLRTKIKAEI